MFFDAHARENRPRLCAACNSFAAPPRRATSHNIAKSRDTGVYDMYISEPRNSGVVVWFGLVVFRSRRQAKVKAAAEAARKKEAEDAAAAKTKAAKAKAAADEVSYIYIC